MKVFTSIPPRRDGTVIVKLAGDTYTFHDDERYGVLSCDMPEEAVQVLLDNGDFFIGVSELLEADVDERTETVAGDDADEDDDGDENAPLIEESVFSASSQPLATTARPRGRPRK